MVCFDDFKDLKVYPMSKHQQLPWLAQEEEAEEPPAPETTVAVGEDTEVSLAKRLA